MDCPRCQEPMNELELQGCRVDVCPKCEGSWYDQEELGQVLSTPRADLEDSTLSPILVEDRLDQVDLEKPLLCPRCGQEMNRYRYLATSEIWLDECPSHGIWLDDGELAQMLDFLNKWEHLDPETEKRLEDALAGIRKEASERDMAVLDRLSRSEGRTGAGRLSSRLLRTIYGLFQRMGL